MTSIKSLDSLKSRDALRVVMISDRSKDRANAAAAKMIKYLATALASIAIAIIPKPALGNWAIANSMGQAGCLSSEVKEAPWVMQVFDEAGYTTRLTPMLVLYMAADARAVYNVINSSNPAIVREIIVVTCGAWPLPDPLRSGSRYAPNGALVYSTPGFYWTFIRERSGGGTNPIRIYHLQRL